MYTAELHAQISPTKMVCRVPIIKKVGIGHLLSGTLMVKSFEGLVAIDLTKNWLRLTPEMVAEIVASMTSRNTQDVWIQEKPNLSYSGTLMQLPDEIAQRYGLHHQERVTGQGECRHNEIVVADEVLKAIYLSSRSITPLSGPAYAVDSYTLDEALQMILLTGRLPQKSPSYDQEFARKLQK